MFDKNINIYINKIIITVNIVITIKGYVISLH